jgi:glutamate--cysteine ligase
MAVLKARLQALPRSALRGMRRGIEKESLRCLPDGRLAATPHPQALGSALTHPHITTDFSEAQLELITGVHGDIDVCLDELTQIHQFVYRSLRQAGDEMMWVGSMPCGLPADENIPIGVYGTSNVARAKSVYRMGLGHRYGRRMQTISGIHYNWSLPGLSDDDYFGLIRNFRRHSFVLLYLFGASPALCDSFVEGREHQLQRLSDHTLYLPHATSLRMGRLGYQSDAQATLAVSYNNLRSYGASLQQALTSPIRPTKPSACAAGRRVQPAGDHAAADRKRVLRHDPAQARDPPRRAAAACAARTRRRVCRGALHGSGPVRAGRHRCLDGAFHRRLPAALPADRQPAGQPCRDRCPGAQPAPGRRGREPGLQLERDGAELRLAVNHADRRRMDCWPTRWTLRLAASATAMPGLPQPAC